MSTSRPKLTLDEQSFQDMLEAAYTIQEHNTRRRRAAQPQPVCERCGTPTKIGERLCTACAGDDLRPGEQLQRKWASLWLMSQEQGLFPDRPVEEEEPEETPAEVRAHRFSESLEILESGAETPAPAAPTVELKEEQVAEPQWPGTALAEFEEFDRVPMVVPETALVEADEEDSAPVAAPVSASTPWNLGDLRLKLRFHRADLYLVVAIIVSTLAMGWVLLATPAVGAQPKPRLRPWERALVSIGLAEAPEAPPAGRGNPNIQVWVDPRTALYYCVGEDLYGKAPGGHVSTQREAQLDQFEPAGRAPCD